MPILGPPTRPINPDDAESELIPPPEGDLTGVYADYVINNRYEKDGHVFMLGNTSTFPFYPNQDTVSFVQLAAGTVLWIVDWTASRWKYKPKIPDPTLRSELRDLWRLIDEHIETGTIEINADVKTPKFRISGTYFYGLKKPLARLNYSVRFPRFPWIKDFANRDVPDSMFEKQLSS